MSLRRTAVISDTHGILRPEAVKVLQTAELILHGGDIAGQKILDELQKTARVIAVRGNCDRDWAKGLPEEVFFELYDRKVYMIHDKKQRSEKAQKADIIIYGHSHNYEEKEVNGRIWLNPGSCGPRRFGKSLTMALLEFETETGKLEIKRIDLPAERGQKTKERKPSQEIQDIKSDGLPPEFDSGRLQRIISMVIGDLQKGKSVDSIVRARKISRELTEQICQIYFTHPGIDVQGVLNRMEIAGL